MSLQIQRIKDCSAWLSKETFSHSQSINDLIDKLGQLSVSLAFVNNQMAIAKKVWNDTKVDAYNSVDLSLSPSVLKDYINAKCSEHQFNYDLCERTSRSMVHAIDSLRTAISALKGEREYK